MKTNYHERESKRIQSELNKLGPEFSDKGIVRTILQRRIAQEQYRAKQLQLIENELVLE